MVSPGSELCPIQKTCRVQREGFFYVTFDIIRERVHEVKEFGACERDSGQQAAGRGQPFQLGTRN